jgi:hypothetical protein
MASNYLEDDSGNKSFMRMASGFALFMSVLLAAYGVWKDCPDTVFPFYITYVVSAFVPKALQKFAEPSVRKIAPINNNPQPPK